ncbi:hypothetical protein HD554DRAFT_2037278 [Boletus coccyginus]|nr:hypothetical protein HD554DRAFT_2037278 [Boletus coccyginus]
MLNTPAGAVRNRSLNASGSRWVGPSDPAVIGAASTADHGEGDDESGVIRSRPTRCRGELKHGWGHGRKASLPLFALAKALARSAAKGQDGTRAKTRENDCHADSGRSRFERRVGPTPTPGHYFIAFKEIIPEFAACLATLLNLTVIQGLVKVLPNLTHFGVDEGKMGTSAKFPLLDTIEILVHFSRQDPSDVKQARKILKENKSQSEKTVLLTKWDNVSNVSRCEFDASDAHDKGSHQGVTTETSVIDRRVWKAPRTLSDRAGLTRLRVARALMCCYCARPQLAVHAGGMLEWAGN